MWLYCSDPGYYTKVHPAHLRESLGMVRMTGMSISHPLVVSFCGVRLTMQSPTLPEPSRHDGTMARRLRIAPASTTVMDSRPVRWRPKVDSMSRPSIVGVYPKIVAKIRPKHFFRVSRYCDWHLTYKRTDRFGGPSPPYMVASYIPVHPSHPVPCYIPVPPTSHTWSCHLTYKRGRLGGCGWPATGMGGGSPMQPAPRPSH